MNVAIKQRDATKTQTAQIRAVLSIAHVNWDL